MKRYEQLAQDISALISSGALRPGDRLPSVRQASVSRKLSPSTIFQAYYLLESRGLVVSQPRAGYFVQAPRKTATHNEPGTAEPATGSTRVAISELVFEVLGTAGRADLVPLGSAFPNPTLFPLDKLARSLGAAMRKLPPERIVEDLTRGNAALCRQIGLRYLMAGVPVEAGELVVTNGAMEALTLCLQAVTRPGDVVAVESPTFYAALQALERLQLKAVEVATHPRHGVDPASLARVIRQHRVKACWFMPNFQNPLGCLMPDAHKQAVVELLARHEIPLIEDDVYSELYFGDQRPLPAKAFDRQGLVMHCSSFSKCLAPGYRVGWVAAGRFATQVSRLKLMSTLSAPIPSQEALSDYLQRGGYDRHLRRLRSALSEQQVVALQAVARHFPKGTRVTRPEGGYFLWVELPGNIDALQLHRLALAQHISLAPGHLFSADRRFSHCLRLNHGHPAPRALEAALKTVGQLAQRLAR